MSGDRFTSADARRVYTQAQEIDLWPGAEYEGTSLLALLDGDVEVTG